MAAFEKEDAIKTLEIVNSWTSNCDTKVEITLGGFAILSGFLLSSDFVQKFLGIVQRALAVPVSVCNIVYVMLLFASIVVALIGVYNLVMVLFPTIVKADSIMFFASVARFNGLEEYLTKAKETKEDELMDDILTQIYHASCICSKKFERQKKGLRLLLIGTMAFVIVFLIGVFIY